MNGQEIIEMARQAGMEQDGGMWFSPSYENYDVDQAHLEAFAKLVAAKEREACAKLCDGLADMHEKMNQWGSHKTADTLAQAIRARK